MSASEADPRCGAGGAAPDAVLVEGALAGSEAAFRELVERYQRPLFALLLRMVRDPALAEELAQDAFVKAFTRLASFDPQHKFSSWLLKIAHNTGIDHLRRRAVETVPIEHSGHEEGADLLAVLSDPAAPSPELAAQRGDLARAIEAAIGRLRPDYREVIGLRFEQGLPYEEIAVVLGLPLGTVKTHIHRARKELAQALGEMGYSP